MIYIVLHVLIRVLMRPSERLLFLNQHVFNVLVDLYEFTI